MCVFCQIVDDSIPSTKVYETEKSIAIFDINPINDGHILVISKDHYGELSAAPSDDILDMIEVVQKLYPVVNEVYEADGITTFENYGLHQEIAHIHFHILPVYKDRVGIEFKHRGKIEGSLKKIEQLQTRIGEINE